MPPGHREVLRCGVQRTSTCLSFGLRRLTRAVPLTSHARRAAYYNMICFPLSSGIRALHVGYEASEDTISPAEVSFMSETEAKTSFTEGELPALTAVLSRKLPHSFQDVRRLDSYARARVINFLRRYSTHPASVHGAEDVFETQLLGATAGDVASNDTAEKAELYHSRVLLPLQRPPWMESFMKPLEHGDIEPTGLWAHGVAHSAKDAELLAAMHAEYIIDELGYHIYTLSSMQRKHAEAARRAGRFAPLPDYIEKVRPSTPAGLPLPLRRVVQRDESEGGQWQLLDTRPSHYLSLSHTMLSPCILDPGARRRVQAVLRAAGHSFTQLCACQAEEANEKGGRPFITASLVLPGDLTAFPEAKVVAQGKALTESIAITLASMHAELLIDTLGIALFPDDAVKQKQHAMAAWSFGRPAPLPDAAVRNPSHLSLPPPLKELVLSKAGRYSVPSAEEVWVRHNRLLTEQTTEFWESPVYETNAVEDLKAFLQRHHHPRWSRPFLHEVIHGTYKATVVLPVSAKYGVRGGVGIAAASTEAADTMAAMHALDVLMALGIPVKTTDAEQAAWAANRAALLRISKDSSSGGDVAAPSPPGRRLSSKMCNSFVTVTTTASGDAATSTASPSSAAGTPPQPRAAARSTPRKVARRAKAAAVPPETSEAHATQPIHEEVASPPPEVKKIAEDPPEHGDAGTSTYISNTDERYLQHRTQIPKDCWSLEADTPDGFILVAPDDNAALKSVRERAIWSPRQLDPLSKERVREYLAGIGRRMEDVFSTQLVDPDENDGLGAYRCVAKFPLPARFGDRPVLGEAALAVDAEHLAAMHAELLLDTLGVCLYADAVKQRQHADACAKHGRWSPSSSSAAEKPSDTPSPPFLRRAYVGSLHWERKQAERRKKREPKVLSRPSATTTRKEDVKHPVTELKNSNDNDLVSAQQLAKLPPLPDDASVTPVIEAELDLVSKARVQYYLRRLKQPASPAVEYDIVLGRGTVHHVGSFTLPLPAAAGEANGNRVAASECRVQGIATTKRDAEVLAWMHAERTLDALGIPIFSNLPGLQRMHASRVRALGRWAPTLDAPGTADDASAARPIQSHVPPLRLSVVSSQDVPRPTYPRNPKAEWGAYIDSCTAYIHAKQMAEMDLYFNLERVPRTGSALYDGALDEAESATAGMTSLGVPEADSKLILQLYCNAARSQYPSFWKSQTVGSITHRVCLVTVAVPGHGPIFAQGVGMNKESAQRRAALHVLLLLRRLDGDFETHFATAKLNFEAIAAAVSDETEEVGEEKGGSSALVSPAGARLPTIAAGESINRAASADSTGGGALGTKPPGKMGERPPVWNKAEDAFTLEGKICLIRLFTVCFDLPPPRVQQRVRIQETTVTHRTVVTVTDEDDQVREGSGTGSGPIGNEIAAYENLYNQLSQQVPCFSALANLLRANPHLHPEKIVNLALTADQKKRIQNIIDSTPHLDEDVEEVLASPAKVDSASDASSSGTLSLVVMESSSQAQESQHLFEQLHEKLTTPEYLEHFAKQRERLSITAHKRNIISSIESSPVLIICGTTGCGKTTQVPQFILDHLTEQGRGGECSIVVTQPRRLSAVSIAKRVAAERLENVGEACGYTIRFDSRPGRHINFCTSGILLRLLHSSPRLEGINYLIIDEIHERDINSDFLLVLLRDILQRRPDLRLILMSATLQAEQFARYFNDAPIINVEGYVHPVQELFIEDLVVHAEAHQAMTPLLKEVAAVVKQSDTYGRMGGGAGGSSKQTGPSFSDVDALTDSPQSRRGASTVSSNQKYGVQEANTEIDYPTVQFAIEQAMRMVDLSNSSVLVFLPGWEEITRAREILERNPKFEIISLHSSVGTEEQIRCFLPPKENKIKVILSTNIAESGVTIDDVGAVIDLGRAKEKSLIWKRDRAGDLRRGVGSMSQLLTVYASRANCVQRRGRVGRTRPGVCIRLYSRQHFQELHDFQTPEMLRTSLDSLCLQILALNLGDPAAFLMQALEPPATDHVKTAMQCLHELGATTADGRLTPLGRMLSMLPVEPRMGKVIVMGVVLRCLDSALTIASVTQTDVFIGAREHRDAVRLHRENISCNTQSDAIASVNGFNFWVTAHYQKSPAEVVVELQERLLGVPQLLMVSRHKRQFFDILQSSGILESTEPTPPVHLAKHEKQQEVFVDRSVYSEGALDVGLVKCVIAAALFPNIAVNRGKRLLRTKTESKVVPSTDSVVHKTQQEEIKQPFFVYNELFRSQESSRYLVRGLTAVSLWTVLLMGTCNMPLTYHHDLSLGFVDDWIAFRSSFGVFELARKLKKALDICLNRKFVSPHDAENNARLETIRELVKELVSTPLKPNNLTTEEWSEKGHIIAPLKEKSVVNSGIPAPHPQASQGDETSTALERSEELASLTARESPEG